MQKNHSANRKNEYGLLDDPEYDRRARESAKFSRRYEYTDQEIEALMNQPKLPNQKQIQI